MEYNQFIKNFPSNYSYDQEVEFFINRVYNSIFDYFDNEFYFEIRRDAIAEICNNLGLRKYAYIIEEGGEYGEAITRPIAFIPNGDFLKILGVIVILRQHFFENEKFVSLIDDKVKQFIDLSNGKLNIRWTNGVFIRLVILY
ncbi:MAG: hypothetical protein IPO62_12620 [Saprospiraceae bacterium]|nr:hypothetical protein [Saprospiraceae bacterium]